MASAAPSGPMMAAISVVDRPRPLDRADANGGRAQATRWPIRWPTRSFSRQLAVASSSHGDSDERIRVLADGRGEGQEPRRARVSPGGAGSRRVADAGAGPPHRVPARPDAG